MVMVRQRIRADSALFDVKEIAYDHWNATHIALRLQNEKLAHGGNPVTRWTAANVAVAQAPPGNLKPAKDKSTERIVALIKAIGRALVAQEIICAPNVFWI